MNRLKQDRGLSTRPKGKQNLSNSSMHALLDVECLPIRNWDLKPAKALVVPEHSLQQEGPGANGGGWRVSKVPIMQHEHCCVLKLVSHTAHVRFTSMEPCESGNEALHYINKKRGWKRADFCANVQNDRFWRILIFAMLVWFALEFSAAFSLTESAPKVEVKK